MPTIQNDVVKCKKRNVGDKVLKGTPSTKISKIAHCCSHHRCCRRSCFKSHSVGKVFRDDLLWTIMDFLVPRETGILNEFQSCIALWRPVLNLRLVNSAFCESLDMNIFVQEVQRYGQCVTFRKMQPLFCNAWLSDYDTGRLLQPVLTDERIVSVLRNVIRWYTSSESNNSATLIYNTESIDFQLSLELTDVEMNALRDHVACL
jgi:hypothetical protein